MRSRNRYRLTVLPALIAGLAAGSPSPADPAEDSGLDSHRRRLGELEKEVRELRASLPLKPGKEVSELEPAEKPEKAVRVGGAVRVNYYWKDFDEGLRERQGDAGLELFRLNLDGSKNDVLVSAEYRWYTYFDAIHHAWAGADLRDGGRVQAGVTRAPFGLLPYAAHNYWFGVPYFIGLGDDYDLGVKYLRQPGAWDFRAAFFKNGELGDPANLNRYSLDVVSVGADSDAGLEEDRNRETNQVNARVAYTFGKDTFCPAEAGISGQWGQCTTSPPGAGVTTGRRSRTWTHAAGAGTSSSRAAARPTGRRTLPGGRIPPSPWGAWPPPIPSPPGPAWWWPTSPTISRPHGNKSRC